MEQIKYTLDFIGVGNAITILTFLIGLFIAFYFYFKTFYRLVYEIETVSNKKTIEENIEFKSRILFYNNGRKTLTNKEIENLQLIISGKVFNIKEIKVPEGLKFKKDNSNINIEFKYLDSNQILLLEISHQGSVSVIGRIAETGQILHNETRGWLIINFIFMIFCLVMTCYNWINYTNPYIFGFNFLLIFFINIIIRHIHRLFFIPDNVSSKYLDTTDKWKKEFRNDF